MNKRKRIIIWIVGGLGAFLLLLFIAMLLAPRLINLESIREKILATASEKVGGEVRFEKVDLSFFPLPHAVVEQASISIPDKVSGTLESLAVYVKIMPLFKGKLQITEVQANSPLFKVKLPKKAAKKSEKEVPSLSLSLPAFSGQILVPLILEVPDLEVEIKKGKLELSQDDQPLFSFQDIDARVVFPPEGFLIDLECASNLWEEMGVKSTLDATDYKGKANIELKNFQPHRLTSQFSEDSPLKLADSSVNMSVDLIVNGLNNLQAKVQGSIPTLSFLQGNKNMVVEARSLKSLFTLDENEIKFSLDELNLEYPKVDLSGGFLLGRRTPRVEMELQGQDVDVPTVREVALAFAGDISDVQEIFGIVRGGKVPLITVKSEGSTYDQVGDLENILIKGHIVEGKILVPDVELDLADVKGDAVISKGVLHGENLEARVGNSWGREGRLKLALQGEDKAFHLDIGVQADLKELPPIMKRLIDDKSFQKEMSLVEDLKGNAVGRLVLGESTNAVKPLVDVSKLNLSATYQRIPYPLEIGAGHFHYDGTKIGVKSLRGKMGNTAVNQLSASLDLEKELYLDIKSADIDFSDEEIITWLKSIEGSGIRLENIRSVKGRSHVSALELKGPLFSPGKWQIKTAYEPRDTVVDTTFLPGPIEITKGKFEGSVDPKRQELTFRDLQIRMLDASMNLSGATYDYLVKGLNNMDLSLDGVVGPESNEWIASLLHTPPELMLQTPYSISKGQLHWKKDAETSFKADITVPGGTSITTDILYSPEETKAKNLIRDEVSRASSAFRLKGREFDLQFKGNLKKETFNNLFVKSGFLYGWLEGDFRAHISLDDPRESTAQGHLMGEDLLFPRELGIPLAIDKIDLKAAERHVDVERAVLQSGSEQLDLKGSLDFTPPGLAFDLDVKSNGITWTQIERLLNEENNGDKGEKSEQGKASWDLPIKGTLKLKSPYFNYDRFTWMPFHADITFAENEINIAVIEATLCNISTPGTVKLTPKALELDFQPAAKGQELNSSVHCFRGEKADLTGKFDLEAKLMSQEKPGKLLESLEGDFTFLAGRGRVQKSVPFEGLLAYLNVLGIIKGELSEMKKEGFAYNSISAKLDLKDGKIIIQEGIIDGLTMDITSRGTVDLVNEKLDVVVLAAPVKTLNTILQKIPIVKRLTKGGLIAVAVKVEGDFADPQYKKHPTTAVGSNLLKMMEKTAKAPFEVIDVEPTGEALDIPMEPHEPKE